jgi:hypothetical protein
MSIHFRNLLSITVRAGAVLLAGAVALGCGKPTCAESSLGNMKAGEVAPILEKKARALLDAVKTGDTHQMEDPFLDLLTVPEKADRWFTATFDPALGNTLSAE